MEDFAHRPVNRDVSVVIGFKDWGLDRLRLAVTSLQHSFGELDGEVIVSDYGSTSCPEAREVVEELGARHLYTETDGVWSRSRALNAGFAQARGRVLVSTDADMLFSPHSMEIIGQRILGDPGEALVLQCRDLPEGFDSALISSQGLAWDTYERMATLRPRWGMGGMMAVSRSAYLSVRGFDERMQIYGGEDLDFAQRIRRSGCRLSWLEDSRVRMFHMWHASSRSNANETAAGRAAIEYNRGIYLNDASYVRNTTDWRHRPWDAPPAASVVIVTRNRAQFLKDSIWSALGQTVRDIEVVVIDDGSTDRTAEVLESFSDPRLRWFTREAQGIPASRNFAARHTRSAWTVIQDDDDIMMPDRVENHLKSLQGGDSGNYGGWVDWRHSDGDIASVHAGKSYSLEALLFAPEVFLHPTLMLSTQLILQVGYDERFTSGSDYNLALRLARLGVSLRHTGQLHLLRRLHEAQVTNLDTSSQQSAARWTVAATLGAIPFERHNAMRRGASQHAPQIPHLTLEDAALLAAPYLPDRLARRDLHVVFRESTTVPALSSQLDLIEITEVRATPSRARCGILLHASWQDMAALRAAGAQVTVLWAGSSEGEGSPNRHFHFVDHCRILAREPLMYAQRHAGRLVYGSPAVGADAHSVPLAQWRSDDQQWYLLDDDTSIASAGSVGEGEGLVVCSPWSHDRRQESVELQHRWLTVRNDTPRVPPTPAPTLTGATKTPSTPSAGASPNPRTDKNATAAHDPQALKRELRATRRALRQARAERAEAVRRHEEVLQRHPALVLLRRAVQRLIRLSAVKRGLSVVCLLVVLAACVLTATLATPDKPSLLFLTLLALVVPIVTASTLLLLLCHLGIRAMVGATIRSRDSLEQGLGRVDKSLRHQMETLVEQGKAERRQEQESAKVVLRALDAHTQVAAKSIQVIERTLKGWAERQDAVLVTEADRWTALTEQLNQMAERLEAGQTVAVSEQRDCIERGLKLLKDLIFRHADEARTATQALREDLNMRAGEQGPIRTQDASVSADIAKQLDDFAERVEAGQRRIARSQSQQIEALLQLFSVIPVELPRPRLGGWAASPDVILYLLEELLTLRPGLVLECGSGASTVWLASAVRAFSLPTSIVALEHDSEFAEQTIATLHRHGLQDVAEVRLAPLKPIVGLPNHSTDWYDTDTLEGLVDIGLLFVDGPPGDTGIAARFPAVPVLHKRLTDCCTIILDDAHRADERDTANRWRKHLTDFSYKHLPFDKGVAIFKRRRNGHQPLPPSGD